MGDASINSYDVQFDSFLYAVILEEESGASLTMLSLLARADMDPWEEAANYARSPGPATVAELSRHLALVMSDSCSPARIRSEAVMLLSLLPSPSFADPVDRKPLWPVIVGLLKWLKDSSGIWIRNDRR
jgi:hypothetical protein